MTIKKVVVAVGPSTDPTGDEFVSMMSLIYMTLMPPGSVHHGIGYAMKMGGGTIDGAREALGAAIMKAFRFHVDGAPFDEQAMQGLCTMIGTMYLLNNSDKQPPKDEPSVN